MTEIEVQSDRPLVTFALFAYNQEKYIREAVEGAFSQTYEPLEIILSDDCSSDRTFGIIQEMAAAYKGPHRVVVRQSSVNIGTLAHIIEVASISRGKYMVVAAGDDISIPDRTQVIIPCFSDRDVLAVSSRDITISDMGVKINIETIKKNRHTYGPEMVRIHGATAAYRTDIFNFLPNPKIKILVEDIIFELLAYVMGGKVESIDTELVKYRHHNENVSARNILSTCSIEVREERFNRKQRLYADALSYFINIPFEGEANKRKSAILKKLQRREKYLSSMASWRNSSFLGRVETIILSRTGQEAKSALSRIFGWAIYRHISNYMSRNQ